MKISSINTIPNIRNYGRVKNNNIKHQTKGEETPKQNNSFSYASKTYNPTFGIWDAIAMGLLYEVIAYAGGAYCTMKDMKKEEKERLAEEQRLAKERTEEVNAISKKMKISFEEAAKYHDKFLKIAAIKPSGDGNEIGLNSVMGYGLEKYKLAVDFITPIVANEQKTFISGGNVPNGLLMYGPPGSGKTYMAQKVCEHLEHFGIRVENISLSNYKHDENLAKITDAFERGKERYKQTGKYTVINIVKDVDTIFEKGKANAPIHPDVAAFLKYAENCGSQGVTWIGTGNEPQNLRPEILESSRIGIKMPVGRMQNFAVADMLKYSLIKHGQEDSAQTLDYQKLVDMMEDDFLVFTPSEIDRIIIEAKGHKTHPKQQLTANMLIREMHNYNVESMSTLTSNELRKFREKRNYVNADSAAPSAKKTDKKNVEEN